MHRIGLDEDSCRGDQKCEEDEKKMYLSFKLELYDAHIHKEPHANMYQPNLLYTFRDSHEDVWYQKEHFRSKHDHVYWWAKISLLGGIYWAWGGS